MRKSRHLTESTKTHWMAWLGSCFGCLLFSYIVAESIPVFNGCGALFFPTQSGQP